MMDFGDWLGTGKVNNAWYLLLDRENAEVRSFLKSDVKGRIQELHPLFFRVETVMKRKKIEEEILKRTTDEDAAIIIFATFGGPGHKVLRRGGRGLEE